MGDCSVGAQLARSMVGFLGFEGLGLGFRIGLDRDLGTDDANGDCGFRV